MSAAARIKGSAILDAEAYIPREDGVLDFAKLHAREMDESVIAYAFDLMMKDAR